ncbi:prolyl oligopeptidase [Murinocardiopsis flavida]|uniref:prolyl oligopeptidase n=1 Tax=Murinocardiopsis flavida TaxID=645275 RepID=A0A2P8DLS1_9ACTN|nr:prolyl oligopeptidase family serine peptidase [Murinocardiopsis flavida]PSK98127.1 prolyl oligopeptidase [Murinocardiopsis flavida]
MTHGRRVPDPFRWLEAPDSPATQAWLAEREPEFAEAVRRWPLRGWLRSEIRGLVAADLWSPPQWRGGTAFATLRTAGAEHPRLLALTGGGRRVLFDPAAFDPSGGTTLDAWEASPDGRHVAVQTSSGGVERGELRVLDTATGRTVEAPIGGVRYSHVAWLPGTGSPAFYYVRRDGADGRRGVWLHRISADADVLVHACAAPRTVPGVRVRRGRWLIVTESHGTGHRNDLWLADLDAGPAEAPPLLPVQVGADAENDADIGPDGLLYIRTTWGAPRRRVCAADPAAPGPEHWREVVPESADATLDGFAPAGAPGDTRVVTAHTRLGLSTLNVYGGSHSLPLPLPGEGMITGLHAHDDGSVSLSYADVATQLVVLTWRPGEHRPNRWPPAAPGAARTTAPVPRQVLTGVSDDGTPIPVTVFSRAGFDRPGPTILHGYGGFGRPRQFGFSATVLAWLNAGGRYAVAHVRGGGDAGRAWHRQGSGRGKVRAVRDLIASGDALVGAGVCARTQLCLSGGSAGGLLVLAAAAQRPDLCAAVIASAPLADMARFELLGLGAMWTREFGTAADPDDFAALMAYSPYHAALAAPTGDGPAVLLTGFHGDTRTDAAHPRKMCAALRAGGRAPDRALLRYEHGVGHGPRSVSRAIDLAADAHAFAAAWTGLAPRQAP